MSLILPNSPFNIVWCFIMLALQVYTATYMPYKICFDDDILSGATLALEYFIDMLFALDVVVNFLSARQNNDGFLVTDLNMLARQYLKTTFTLDVLCSIPS